MSHEWARAHEAKRCQRVALRREWVTALKDENRGREALGCLIDAGDSNHGGALRRWWGAVEKVLFLYERGFAEGIQLEPAPVSMLSAIRGMAGYLAVGKIPDPIAFAKTEGRHAAGPTERQHIGLAVAYLRAANGGIEDNGNLIVVLDRHPTKTVAEAFGVKRRTVQGWRNRYEPAFLGVNDVNAEVLTSLMRKAAKVYRKEGRSSQAVAHRDAKRGESN